MKLDVESLGTFSRLAGSGAERAALALSQLTNIDTFVDVARIELSNRADVAREFDERNLMSVQIGFSGAIDGRTVLALDRESADRIVETLVSDETLTDDLATSGLKEVGNILLGGFIDGWADYLESSIDISTPTYVDVDGEGPLAGLDTDEVGDQVLVFRNELETVDGSTSFQIYMVPTTDAIGTIVEAAGSADEAVPIETFSAFSRMIDDGAEQASADITAMTGMDTQVDISRLNFVPIEDVPAQSDDTPRIGVVLEFEGLPSGYIAILFDDRSGSRVTNALLPGMDDDPAMRQSAIQEIGNIVTSGFLDGWANALETTIRISPPQFVDDLAPAIISPLATKLAQTQEYAFLIDSTIRTSDDEFTCDIYALPDEQELHRALDQLSLPVA